MAGPVWRFDAARAAVCDRCLRPCTGVYLEGDVTDNELRPVRAICPECMAASGLVVGGEDLDRAVAPAYAHNAD